jgi:hypothetical protein
MDSNLPDNGQILLYQTQDGKTGIQVTLKDETVWLTQNQMAELFQREKSVISKHIKKIFETGELEENSVIAKFATTASDGKTYDTNFYNLTNSIMPFTVTQQQS